MSIEKGMDHTDSFLDCGYVLRITTFLFKEEKMDFEKLAIAIIYAWESDREESGRCEIVKGMRNVLRRHPSEHDREIIDEMLITFTGYSLQTLIEKSEELCKE